MGIKLAKYCEQYWFSVQMIGPNSAFIVGAIIWEQFLKLDRKHSFEGLNIRTKWPIPLVLLKLGKWNFFGNNLTYFGKNLTTLLLICHLNASFYGNKMEFFGKNLEFLLGRIWEESCTVKPNCLSNAPFYGNNCDKCSGNNLAHSSLSAYLIGQNMAKSDHFRPLAGNNLAQTLAN